MAEESEAETLTLAQEKEDPSQDKDMESLEADQQQYRSPEIPVAMKEGVTSNCQSRRPRIITHQPAMAARVELQKAEVPWTRFQERLVEMEKEQIMTTEFLYRKFLGILNKLTPQKFQALVEQALGLEINTEERLKGCIDMIFTKAVNEPLYAIAYANLCKVMSPIKVEWVQEDGKTKSNNFRRMLLTKCQQEFEKDKKDDETIETMKEAIEKAETEEKCLELQGELTNQMTRMRKRSLGNLRFIGEFFKLKMLSEIVMHECITRLLKSSSDDESLECFTVLIKITGRDLDKSEDKSRIDAYFKRITDIIKKGKISTRIKFMLQDVQELRDNEWVPRVRQDKQLKTIDQIRIEAKAEEEKEKEMVQQHQVLKWRTQKPERDRKDREKEREKVDQSKLQGLFSRRAKEKSGFRVRSLGGCSQVEMEEEQIKTDELYQKFQGILNKLTPQKFQALAEQALGLEINTEEHLKGCIDKIFTKALEEPNFSIAYANLCKVMSPIKVEWVQEEGKTKSTNFRRMLLTKLQQEFGKDKKDDETIETMKEAIEKAETEEKRLELQGELTNQMTRMRKRSLGNIRFIGELFKLKMLSEIIMHECITRLLKSSSDEESLECFAGLIKTTGRDLDRPEAKSRMDAYFKRITDIIKKGKIPARIKFMLQDVQELRNNEWVPRVIQRDKQLKTIDQIRLEAKEEEVKEKELRTGGEDECDNEHGSEDERERESKLQEETEKEMVQQHQVLNMVMGRGGGGRDGKRGSKDEWSQKPERDRRDREREREKVDHSKLQGLLSRRAKEKSGAQMSLGPNTSLRPTGWNKGKGRRSSSKKSEGRGPVKGSGSGVKQSHTTLESEKEAALMTVSKFTNQTQQTHPPLAHPPPSRDAPAQAILKPTPSTKDKLDEATVQRKTISIIEEFVTNSDLKEAVEYMKEVGLSAMMNMVVREGINHVLERKAEQRICTGRLFRQLIHEKILPHYQFLDGLNDVLEYADDMSIDIPKIWDYLGEVLTPVMAHSTINFALLGSIRSSLVESGKAAVLVAKVLWQCLSELGSQEAVRDLWTQSRLDWASLGMRAEDLGEFLERQNLGFLQPEETPPYHIAGLQELLSSDQTNKDIMTSLEKFKSYDLNSARFIRSLGFSVVFATVTGLGDSAIFKKDLFERRCGVIKECKRAKYSLEVLYGLQVAVAKLKHPPKLLDEMFNILYNLEIMEEEDFYTWRDKGTEKFGKGNALMVVKPFFDWLQLDEENPP